MSISADHRHGSRFDHRALVVDADDTIERVLVPHLRQKILAGQAVTMVVGADTTAIVRDRLGGDADTLQWVPVDRFYQRLGFAYTRFLSFLREQHSQQQIVHVFAEPDIVSDIRSPVDRAAAYMGYESMANGVFTGYRCPVTCIWHRRHHPASLIDEVRRVHPRELIRDGVIDNPGYVPPDDFLTRRPVATMTPIPPATDLDITVWSLRGMAAGRTAVAHWASLRYFLPTAVQQVVTAAGEVIANGLRHGRAPVRVRAWKHDTTLVVHVEDAGGIPIPAHAGYRPPVGPAGSAGLWVARQLADVLLTHTGNGRTAVRMYFPYLVTHRSLDIPT